MVRGGYGGDVAGSQGDADQGDAKRADAKLADAARGDATQSHRAEANTAMLRGLRNAEARRCRLKPRRRLT